MNAHFLDANIFLEVNIDESDYGEECDEMFRREYSRFTSNKIMTEVDNVKKRILEAFDLLQKHLLKSSSKFLPKKRISERLMDKIREIEESLKIYSGQAKRFHVNKLRSLFISTVEHRKNNLEFPLIANSGNIELQERLSDVIPNENDAWHITDAYSWCFDKCSLIFWSIDNHVVSPKREIKQCLSEYSDIEYGSCPLDIEHIKNIYQL